MPAKKSRAGLCRSCKHITSALKWHVTRQSITPSKSFHSYAMHASYPGVCCCLSCHSCIGQHNMFGARCSKQQGSDCMLRKGPMLHARCVHRCIAPLFKVKTTVQALFQVCAVCPSWREIGKRVFFSQPWKSATLLCHPLQLFTTVSTPVHARPHSNMHDMYDAMLLREAACACEALTSLSPA